MKRQGQKTKARVDRDPVVLPSPKMKHLLGQMAKSAAPIKSTWHAADPSGAPFQHEFRARGHRWRVQSDERGRFDELVVVVGKEKKKNQRGSGLIVHAEMLSDRSCFVDVAGFLLWVSVGDDGIARITHMEDTRAGED